MRTTFPLLVLVALTVQAATRPATAGKAAPAASLAPQVPSSQPTVPGRAGDAAAVARRLLGPWEGGPCVGHYTFDPDGTFELRAFTPGGNTLTGTWSVRSDAPWPTLLVLTCKTSDFKQRDPDRPEYQHLGKAVAATLVALDDRMLVLRFPNAKGETRYARPAAGPANE